MTVWTLTIPGDPAPKGSLKCVGPRVVKHAGPVLHQLVEDDKAGRGKAWRKAVTAAAKVLRDRIGRTLDAPLGVAVLAVIPRDSKAAETRWLPAVRNGDVDKLARMVLDAMDDADVYGDDSRICMLLAGKVYEAPDLPAGAWVLVWELTAQASARAMTALLKRAPELT